MKTTKMTTREMPFGQYQGQPFTEITSSYLLWLWAGIELREPLRGAVKRELEARLSNYLNEIPSEERHSFVGEATAALRRAGKSLTDISIFVAAYRLAEPQYGELPTRSRNGIGGNYGLTRMPFGKFKGQSLSELEDWYVYWLAEQGYGEPLRSALEAELEQRRRKAAPAQADGR